MIDQAAPTVLTYLARSGPQGRSRDGSALDLGSVVHDSATVSGGGASNTDGAPSTSRSTARRAAAHPTRSLSKARTDVPLVINGVADPSDATDSAGSRKLRLSRRAHTAVTPTTQRGVRASVSRSRSNKGQLTADTTLHAADHTTINNGGSHRPRVEGARHRPDRWGSSDSLRRSVT